MTLHIVDIASYQGSLSLAEIEAAGFRGINVKVSHGIGQKSVHEYAADRVRDARARGFALSCFHWLTGEASGVAQADYAYKRMATLGLNVPGVAHVVDVEEGGIPAGTYADYCARMAALLGRPIITYTGDWYAESRSWLKPSPASPWLWSAPRPGYLMSYPGDASVMWDDGYAGWAGLAAMQYRVAKIAGTDVSQSAVRDAALWAQMTGVPMPSSQNGWPVVGQSAVTDRALFGVEFPNGWLKGDVDMVFTYLIGRLHREVEPLDNGGCWGWFVKNIEGSDSISNHASATAVDYNAPAHPMGVRNTYSAAKRAKIRAILADLDGVVRWGGDYTGRPDDMHFEINKSKAAVKAVADRLRAGEEDMDWADDVIANPSWRADSETNPTVQAKFAIADSWTRARNAEVNALAASRAVDALKLQLGTLQQALLAAINNRDDVDETALAAALVPGLSAAILADLPDGALTQGDVEAAVRNVLLHGADPS